MKHAKPLGLASLVAAALMAFAGAGTASATQFTCGATHCPVGTVVHLQSEGKIILDPPFGEMVCSNSTLSGKTTTTGGAAEAVNVAWEIFTMTECNSTMTVLKTGSSAFHTQGTSANNNGTMTWSGMELTQLFFGTHCIFRTNSTDIGTVAGSATTKGNATLDLAATVPRTGGSSGVFCGSTAQWTGAYQLTKPSVLNIH